MTWLAEEDFAAEMERRRAEIRSAAALEIFGVDVMVKAAQPDLLKSDTLHQPAGSPLGGQFAPAGTAQQPAQQKPPKRKKNGKKTRGAQHPAVTGTPAPGGVSVRPPKQRGGGLKPPKQRNQPNARASERKELASVKQQISALESQLSNLIAQRTRLTAAGSASTTGGRPASAGAGTGAPAGKPTAAPVTASRTSSGTASATTAKPSAQSKAAQVAALNTQIAGVQSQIAQLKSREVTLAGDLAKKYLTAAGVCGIVSSRNGEGAIVPDITKSWEDAWRTEPRDQHGRWVKGLLELSDTMAAETAKHRAEGTANSRYMTAGRDFKKAAKALAEGRHDEAQTHLDAAITHVDKATKTSDAGTAAGEKAKLLQREIAGGAPEAPRAPEAPAAPKLPEVPTEYGMTPQALAAMIRNLSPGAQGEAFRSLSPEMRMLVTRELEAPSAPEAPAAPTPTPAPTPPSAPKAPKPAKKTALVSPSDLTASEAAIGNRHTRVTLQQSRRGIKPHKYQVLASGIRNPKGDYVGIVDTKGNGTGTVEIGNRSLELQDGWKVRQAGGTTREAHAANVEEAKSVIAGETNAKKVRAALIAGGHSSVSESKSQMVRGWSTFSPGFEVRGGKSGVAVSHFGGTSISSRNVTDEQRRERNDKRLAGYAAALEAKGIPYERRAGVNGAMDMLFVPHPGTSAPAPAPESPAAPEISHAPKPAGGDLPAPAPAPEAPGSSVTPAPKAVKPERVQSTQLQPGDRVYLKDAPDKIRTVASQSGGVVRFADGGVYFPDLIKTPLYRAPGSSEAPTSAGHLKPGDSIPADVLSRAGAFPLGVKPVSGSVRSTFDTQRGHGYVISVPGSGMANEETSVFHDDIQRARGHAPAGAAGPKTPGR